MLILNQVYQALYRQPPIAEATINNTVLEDYIELSYNTNVVMHYQGYIPLQGQVPMVGCIISNSVSGDGID
jgi:hypothetical protein